MASTRNILLAGALLLIATPAFAADMPPPDAAPISEPEPLSVAAGGWYLRGDIGFSNQEVDELDNALYANTTSIRQRTSFDGAPFGGVGVGYRFNQWFRMDVTGEYRSNASFHGRDQITFVGTGGTDEVGANVYTAQKSEIVGLANAYFDLGTWNNITPFIGGSIGFSRNRITSFTDSGVTSEAGGTTSLAFGGTRAKTNFAWGLTAGLGYQVAPGLTLEAAYRYMNLGDGETADMVAYDGTNNSYNPMHFKDITSHDFKIGMRWALGGSDPVEPISPEAPLMRKF